MGEELGENFGDLMSAYLSDYLGCHSIGNGRYAQIIPQSQFEMVYARSLSLALSLSLSLSLALFFHLPCRLAAPRHIEGHSRGCRACRMCALLPLSLLRPLPFPRPPSRQRQMNPTKHCFTVPFTNGMSSLVLFNSTIQQHCMCMQC